VEARGGPRIAFVGGGSYQWGPKIIQDLALNEELRGGVLVLHDINAEALQDMFEWGTRALGETKADLKLEKTQRLEEALRGADFVILSISTGGSMLRRWIWRSPPATGWCRPSATPSDQVVSSAACGTSLWSWG
jgi:alpha-galactosidase/6-phospho-beta-glucosidase family protein